MEEKKREKKSPPNEKITKKKTPAEKTAKEGAATSAEIVGNEPKQETGFPKMKDFEDHLQREVKTKKRDPMWVYAIVGLLVLVCMITFFHFRQSVKPAPAITTTKAVSTATIETTVVVPKESVIKKGDGYIRIFKRQLASSPEKFGYVGKTDKKAIRKWANKKAHEIAVKSGVLGKEKDMRIKGSAIGKVAVVILKEADKISIGFAKIGSEKIRSLSKDKLQMVELAPDIKNAKLASALYIDSYWQPKKPAERSRK